MCQVRVPSAGLWVVKVNSLRIQLSGQDPQVSVWGNWFGWSCPCNPCHLFEWKHTWSQKKFLMDCFVLIFVSGWWNSIEFIYHLILRSITFNCHQKTQRATKGAAGGCLFSTGRTAACSVVGSQFSSAWTFLKHIGVFWLVWTISPGYFCNDN